MDLVRALILLVVGCVVAFFLFQIGVVLYNRMNETNELREHLVGAQYVSNLTEVDNTSGDAYTTLKQNVPSTSNQELLGPTVPEVQGRNMPDVPGQTEEQLRRKEPNQRRVNRPVVDEPEPVLRSPEDMSEAHFTEDLRHPEASFQPHPSNKKSVPVDTGIASQISSPGLAGDQQKYDSDMAQNGGEWLPGAFAFDKTEKNGFSPLF
jgi:hypothetical protein